MKKTRGQSSATHTASRPFVVVNVAMTADGKIATANRAVSSFGSKHDHDHLFELRATADAVMSGARTVDLNPVTLGPGAPRFRRLRLKRGLAEYNLRVIVSGSGSIDPESEIFRQEFSPIIILTTLRAPENCLARLTRLGAQVKVCGRHEIDFPAALHWLRKQWKVKRLICEGGGELNDAMFRAGLVDEVHVTVCPVIVGGRAAPTMADGSGAAALPQSAKLVLRSLKKVGAELFLVFSVRASGEDGRRGNSR